MELKDKLRRVAAIGCEIKSLTEESKCLRTEIGQQTGLLKRHFIDGYRVWAVEPALTGKVDKPDDWTITYVDGAII